MARVQHACVTVRCDRCGDTFKSDEGYTPHFPLSDPSRDWWAEFEDSEWRVIDGRDLCEDCWTFGEPPDDDPDAEVYVELPPLAADPAARP